MSLSNVRSVTDMFDELALGNPPSGVCHYERVQGRGRPRSTSPTRAGENTRAEILDAAAELITSQGFGATTTRQIAEAVGVRQNVLYHHFGSKEQILGSLLEALVRPSLEVADALSTVRADTPTDAAGRLYALAFQDARVLATWRWNLGVLFALPEAHSAAFDSAHQMRARLRQRYLEFTAAVTAYTGAAVNDFPFRLVESIAAIRADGQLTAETAHDLAVGSLRLAGWAGGLDAVIESAHAAMDAHAKSPRLQLR